MLHVLKTNVFFFVPKFLDCIFLKVTIDSTQTRCMIKTSGLNR